MKSLTEVLEEYSQHPEFLGLNLVDANQKGALDDTPLHIAARLGRMEDIETLFKHGANIDAIGDLGNTPLHQAAMAGKMEAVKLLLAYGAKKQLKNEFNQTPLSVAELGKHYSVIKILKKQ